MNIVCSSWLGCQLQSGRYFYVFQLYPNSQNDAWPILDSQYIYEMNILMLKILLWYVISILLIERLSHATNKFIRVTVGHSSTCMFVLTPITTQCGTCHGGSGQDHTARGLDLQNFVDDVSWDESFHICLPIWRGYFSRSSRTALYGTWQCLA